MGNNSLSPVLIILAIFAIAGIALAVVLISRKGKTGSTLPRVVVASGNHQGRQVNVGAQPVVIGRDADCGIVIDEPLISRKHVQVSFANGIFTLEDLGSAHGTYVNGMRAYQERVPPGTQFTIGNVTLSVLSGAVTPQIRQAAPVVVPLAAPPRVSTVQPGAASGLEGYEIKEKIKEGGQVIVHRALSKSDGRQVVIKFLSTVSYDTEGKFFRRKFEQQLSVGASIRHPHCVQIDGGSANSNPPYMVEEFLSGGTLLDRMRAGTLTLADVIRIIGQTCDALGYLHKRDIIHRDVTPSNIMFDPAGQVKVIDFGVAHFANMPSATSVGMVVGKVKYLSVEAANGARVVPQSDLYSLGIIAYEMLAGKPPFMGSDPDVLAQHLRTRPVPLRQVNPAIPERIEWAVMKALEKNPADRFRNAEEMARAFTYDAPFSAGVPDTGSRRPAVAPTPREGQGAAPAFDQTMKGFAPLRLRREADGQTILIGETPTIVNRALLNPADTSISRSAHGELLCRESQWYVRENPAAPSANGIFVDNTRVADARALRPGETVRFGNSVFRIL
ncbi:MAG: protein kinase [Anaerolineae bacterium]|nr:protein kinase [Anaerolineae bacterium]